ncbi:thiol:disulfide interchange protein [Pedobacter sp. AK017]|uniref:thioredoxin family protein n=1 Tax=Pedobacter sp. AK017 TaxID=2723073 RepID=UPI0016167A5A|nr:thioredoxin fold domain-containing protein [Pedobacter sp. AK017]MBB5438103.1 thiol:disulfide interchange protein [Pedobacter sp. AK017]
MHAKTSGIRFIANMLPVAIKQAKASKKYIFVDAYADWCGPCKLLKSSTFADLQVSTFFNSHFVNVAIDMEKGGGIALAEDWDIQAYPTLLILDSTGKVVFRSVGFLRPKELLEFGRQGLNR